MMALVRFLCDESTHCCEHAAGCCQVDDGVQVYAV